MNTFLQWWGGSCYLLAKILLAHAGEKKYGMRALGWGVYLLGVPPWVCILCQGGNLIAMAVEAGGASAMVLGLVVAIKKLEQAPPSFDTGVRMLVGALVAVAIFYGGVTTLSQVLELGVAIGFLVGTYLLAKGNWLGWTFFVLMHTSMGTLMELREQSILAALQWVSILVVFYGVWRQKKEEVEG